MFKSITPKFISRLDTYLLVNYPVLWMSKIHYVLWHGALLWGLSALLGAVMPINLKNNIGYGLWYFLLTVLGVVILCFWVYNYVIFNKEKKYGTRKFSDEYKNFILVFFSVGIFLLVPWPFEIIFSQRVANMYTDKEILEDLNKLNETDPYLASSTNNYYSWYDSVTKAQYFNIRQLNPYNASYYTPYYMKIDSAKYPGLLTEFQLYKKYKPVSDTNVLIAKIGEFITTAQKYDCRVNETPAALAKKYLSFLSRNKISTTEFYGYGGYQYELSITFNNLCEAKFKPLFIFTHDYLWVMFYFIISITALLLLFKMVYWQQFLIMLVVLLLYPLVMFIFSQLMPYNDFMRSAGFFETSLLALLLFSGISLFITAKENHHYRPFYTIFNQLFYVTLIFSPLLLIVFLHDTTNLFHNHDYWDYVSYHGEEKDARIFTPYESQLGPLYYAYWTREYDRWITIMKYTGIVMFILGLPVFKNLFIKQVALPEKQ